MPGTMLRFKVFGRRRFRDIDLDDVRAGVVALLAQGADLSVPCWSRATIWARLCVVLGISNTYTNRRRLMRLYKAHEEIPLVPDVEDEDNNTQLLCHPPEQDNTESPSHLPEEEGKDEVEKEKAEEEEEEEEMPYHTQESDDTKEQHPEESLPRPEEPLFCLCRQPNDPNQPYAQCSGCQDWFHPWCVDVCSIEDLANISPWFCPNCSKQPQQQAVMEPRQLFVQEKQTCTSPIVIQEGSLQSSGVSTTSESSGTCQSPRITYPDCYQLTLSRGEWEEVKPRKTVKGKAGHLEGSWADIFARKIGVLCHCVLAFDRNRTKVVSSRKKNSPFWYGRAHCKYHHCRTFHMIILDNPSSHNQEVIVDVHVYGVYDHSTAISYRRHTRKAERGQLKRDLGEFAPTHLHTKKLAAADKEKLISGNFDEVPSITVIQKISSEKNLDDRLHKNTFLDVLLVQQQQDIKSPTTPLKHHYVQYIAIAPFITHMYSITQLHVLHDETGQGELCLYLDATGTVVKRPPNTSNILYYALCSPLKSKTKTVVALAEMLTSDQTTVTIQHWLHCLSRDYSYVFRRDFHPTKVETDFSWAIIHATVQCLSKCNIHEYLRKCLQIFPKTERCTFTIVHICAAHLLKLVADKTSKVKCRKATRHFFLHAFALLQNAQSLEEIEAILLLFSNTFTLRDMTSASYYINELNIIITQQGLREEVKEALATAAMDTEDIHQPETPKSIVKDSPFSHLYKDFTMAHTAKQSQTKCGKPTNPHFCPDLLLILRPYLATIPLWTGVMLKDLNKSRDTNAYVENWFRTVKTVVLHNKLRRRPGQFIQVMEEFVRGRLQGANVHHVRMAEMTKVEKEKESTQEQPLTQKETWKKRAPKKEKSKYYNPPKQHQKDEARYTSPPWSGQGAIKDTQVRLINTCTIDNLLYIIHLILTHYPSVEQQLKVAAASDDWIQSLLEVHQDFTQRRWSQGRIGWLKRFNEFFGQKVWDCFGDEYHFVVSRLSNLQRVKDVTRCSSQHCAFSLHEKDNRDLEVVCVDFTQLQNHVDEWCHPEPRPCGLIDKRGLRCNGRRESVSRQFTNGEPSIIVLRLLAPGNTKLNTALWPSKLPLNIQIFQERYRPVGLTYHQHHHAHFVSFHRLCGDGWHYYDGMEELSNPGHGDRQVSTDDLKNMMDREWLPGHLVLVQISDGMTTGRLQEDECIVVDLTQDTPEEISSSSSSSSSSSFPSVLEIEKFK